MDSNSIGAAPQEGARVFAYPLIIRESHLDTFGHVNNATYLQIYEEARWELATELGFGLEEVRSSGIGMAVLEATVRFLKELRLRQRVEVRTRLGAVKGKVFVFKQAIVDEEGQVANEADFTMARFDLGARKILPLTPEWLALLGRPDSSAT